MLSEPGVLVLVEVGAVEEAKPVDVAREVGGDPVDQDAVAVAVEGVDEVGEIVRSAVAGRRGEVADGLVAPTAVERVLVDRQQLDVGEMQVLQVGDEIVGQLAIIEEAVRILGLRFQEPRWTS